MTSPTDQDEREGLPSASEWARLELCPPSYQLSRRARELGQEAHSEPNKFSAKGDKIHQWLQGVPGVELSESELMHAQFLRGLANGSVLRIFGPGPVTELREHRMWFQPNGVKQASGKADYVVYSGAVGLIIDYKTGWSPIDAEESRQLGVLACLLGAEIRYLKEIICQIVSKDGISEARFDRAALREIWLDMVTTVKRLHDPQVHYNPSPEACKYCPAAIICPALAAVFTEESLPAHGEKLPDGEGAAALLNNLSLAEARIAEIRAYYTRKLEADSSYTIPGWHLAAGSPSREILDWEKAHAILSQVLPPEALNGASSFRLGELERALAKAMGITQDKAKEELNKLLGNCIGYRAAKKPTLRRTD